MLASSIRDSGLLSSRFSMRPPFSRILALSQSSGKGLMQTQTLTHERLTARK